jgi:ABC-type branched-subunit amino acid transport system ATPase component/ABC-type branched-subunit amino acid transport system permease subunit
MERTIGRDVGIILIVAIVYLAASMLIENQYYQLMLTLVPVWAILGIAWNVFSGYSGMVSFGHASFFGLGAYTVTLLLVKLDVSPWCGIPIGMVVGVIAGALIGWPTFRLRGHYFALAMLAYPLALLYIFEWLGFQEVSLPMKRASPAAFMQFKDYRWYVAIALVMLVIAMAISLKIERSRFGLSLLAIKQNEPAAEAAGINTRTWKIRALMVSGAIAAGIGGFYAVVLLIVTPPSVFGMLTSAQALIVTLFGGVATVWGPVVGSAMLIPLAEVLQAELGDKIPGIQGVVFGVAIVLVILLAPEGIVPHIREALRRRRAEGTAGAAASTVLAAVHQPPAMTGHAHRTVSEEVVLKVEGLSRAFGGLKAVEDVSFDVRKGEVLGIIGPNGAGKTTLFNLLNGFLLPNAGQVIWANENLVGMRPNAICRRGIGRTFQVVRPFQRMTVLQNVVVGAFVAESDDEKALALAGEALARVGMADRAGVLAGGLTNVELRLMELARALASRPQLLLLDETLAGLGSQEVERMLTVIDGLARGGATIVIIEHTMQAMVRLADRFVVLDHGRMLAQGKPEEVTKHPSVIEAYLGKRWMKHAQH